MPKKYWSFFIIVLVLLGTAVFAFSLHRGSSSASRFEQASFEVVRADGESFFFKASVAKTDAEQAYGLMFVREMADKRGMIFAYERPRKVSFWMKNTLIPLDILFVREDGGIFKIFANAKPLDETPISSDEPVIAVIEINAGLAEKYGINVGDKVKSSVFIAQ